MNETELIRLIITHIGFILWCWVGWGLRKNYELRKRIKQIKLKEDE